MGEEHPDTLTSAANFAMTLADQEKFAEAEGMLHATLAARRRVLCSTHPETLATAQDLEHVRSQMHAVRPTKTCNKAAARRIERAAAPALSPTAMAEAEARARAAEAELLSMLDREELEVGVTGRSGSAKGKAKGQAKGKGGKVNKSVPIPVGSSTASVNDGVVASISSSSTLQANVSAECVVCEVVEEMSPTRSDTKSADSQSNTPSSVYDTKPESTDATPYDDTQIMAVCHLDVTLESKKWIFGVVALVVLLVAVILVLLVVSSRSRLVAKENYDF